MPDVKEFDPVNEKQSNVKITSGKLDVDIMPGDDLTQGSADKLNIKRKQELK